MYTNNTFRKMCMLILWSKDVYIEELLNNSEMWFSGLQTDLVIILLFYNLWC